MSASPPLGRRAPEQRHAAVLEAAQSLFLAQGVESTSIDAIAKRAGVAKGTVYLYFASKEHIARELETRFNARIVDRARTAATNTSGSIAEVVEAWCVELVESYLDELDVHDMLFYGRGPASREDIAENALIDDLTALLAAHDIGTPGDTAAFLIGGTTLLVDRAILEHTATDRTCLVQSTRRLVRVITLSLAQP